jgi:hypothetical protein
VRLRLHPCPAKRVADAARYPEAEIDYCKSLRTEGLLSTWMATPRVRKRKPVGSRWKPACAMVELKR